MDSKRNAVKVHIAANGVEVTTPPYLDGRIDPADLLVDVQFPDASKLAQPANYKELKVNNQSVRLYKELGHGGFGKVYLAQIMGTGEWVALKQIFFMKMNAATYLAEIESLRAGGTLIDFDPQSQLTIMSLLPGMELSKFEVNVDPEDRIQNISLLQRFSIAKEMLKRVAGLHKDVAFIKNPELRDQAKGMLHRDIKPENMLYEPATNTISICDLGMAAEITSQRADLLEKAQNRDKENKTKGQVKDGLMGTPYFISPELFSRVRAVLNKGKRKYNEATEVYALGVSIAEVVGLKRVKDNQYHDQYGSIPKELVKLIHDMIHKNPAKRPSVIVAAQRMNKIHFEYAKTAGLKVCVISIRELLNMKDGERNRLFEHLKHDMNAVTLTGLNSENVTLQEYYQARYALMQAGVFNVSPFMLRGETHEANIRVVKDYYDGAFATVHTAVAHYDKGAFLYKTPPAAVITEKAESKTLMMPAANGLIAKLFDVLISDEDPAVKRAQVDRVADALKFLLKKANIEEGADSYQIILYHLIPKNMSEERLAALSQALEKLHNKTYKNDGLLTNFQAFIESGMTNAQEFSAEEIRHINSFMQIYNDPQNLQSFKPELPKRNATVISNILVDSMRHMKECAEDLLRGRKKDLAVINKLPDFSDAASFVKFVKALEAAYIASLKSSKTMFGPKVTEEMINKSAPGKYILPRTLGLMLKTAYEKMREMQIDDTFEHKAKNVLNMNYQGKYERLKAIEPTVTKRLSL